MSDEYLSPRGRKTNCKNEGATHFACDCLLEQLRLADELAKAIKTYDQHNPVAFALAAYELARNK